MGYCVNCGKEIDDHRKYCSFKCKRKYLYENKSYNKTCNVCGRIFFSRAGVTCCSKECSIEARKNVIKVCKVCNTQFRSTSRGLYCSSTCRDKANEARKKFKLNICKVCGKRFRAPKGVIMNCCSEECSSKFNRKYIDESLKRVLGTNKNVKSIVRSRIRNEEI